VGKFDSVSTSLGKLKISVLATPGKKQLCYLALDYAKKFVAFYENYFGIKYPLPKLDLIAIPDFAAGAMENWGAITFRETAMLGTEKGSAVSYKQQIAETVAHELAHQWFGDLVTMEWWNDLWLNESFATYMSFKAMEAVFPEWQMDVQYFDEVIATAFSADSLINTHPISVDVSTPEEINEIFDEISYEKGGTFLHMLEDFATPKVFRAGLHTYLKTHSYSNATKYDLWNSIYEEAKKLSMPNGKFIKEFANKWLDNVGYPLVIVKEGQKEAKLSQQRFVISKPISTKVDHQNWIIPIKYLNGNTERFKLMTEHGLKVAHEEKDTLKLNYKQDYLYRVMYEKQNLEKLGQWIKSGKLSGLDAWGVENDLFALMRSGNVKATEYMDFIKNYYIGVGYPANASILSHIDWLDFMLYETKLHNEVKSLGFAFAGELLKNLGWNKKKNDKNIDSLIRSHSIRLLGQLGKPDVVKKANAIFAKYTSGNGSIDPNLRSSIYATCAANGDSKFFGKILSMYREAKDPEEKRRLLQTFGYFTSKPEISKALKLCMSAEVRLQDSFVIPAIMSGNHSAFGSVEQWTYDNWKELMEKYDIGTHMLPRYIDNLSMCSSKKQYLRVESFFKKKGNFRGDIKISLKKTLERIMANSTFRSKNGI
ncbi:MAG: M1 family aminopeptidase, partial [Methanothrix sp.]